MFEIADQSGQTGLTIAPEQIALVLPPRKHCLFYKIVAPLLRRTSRIRSRKALAVAFQIIGRSFMGYEHRAVRRLVKKFQNGPVTSIPQGAALGAAVLLL